jgi:formimidoylglutamate deiminase
VLDTDAPPLFGLTGADAIDRWIFSGNRNLVRDVYVGGRRVVVGGHHVQRDAIAARYRAAITRLMT